MSFLNELYNRIVGHQYNEGQKVQELSDPGKFPDIVEVPDYKISELISKLRNTVDCYNNMYNEYFEMGLDTIINSALEMYADDATQVDTKSSRIIGITSQDTKLCKDILAFLDSIEADNRVWNWAYQTAQFGDYYLRVLVDKDTNALMIDDTIKSLDVMELFEHGLPIGYAYRDPSEYAYARRSVYKNQPNNDVLLYDSDNFVHFYTSYTPKFEPIELMIPEEKDEHGDPLIRKFTIKRGVSMIEGIRQIYRILQLVEDTLLMAKIGKSNYTRLVNIEVGSATPAQTSAIVRKIKGLFDSRPSIDINNGQYNSTKIARPMNDPIFNPTRNGVGAISIEEVGGNLEIRSLADLDYFNNKFFAGLKIPKVFFSWEESLPGGLGDNTLTRLDIRYSRHVKRLQNALLIGITSLIDIWLRHNDRQKDVGNYKVVLAAPSTAEELGRLTEFSTKMDIINNTVANLANAMQGINTGELYKVFLKEFLNYSALTNELTPIIDEYIKNPPQQDDGY